MPKAKAAKPKSALMLRTCAADMSAAHNGFIWPRKGKVVCPDWNPAPKCGGGLHGLLWGVGDASLLNWSPDAIWMVVEIETWVDLEGKVKAPSGTVLYAGDRNT